MRKKWLVFNCAALMILIQGTTTIGVMAISETQKNVILGHCDAIKDNLRTVQKRDARTRVYLGRYYETILTKFMTPLNVKLVEENLSSGDLVENQSQFAEAKTTFSSDFVNYQQKLEELVGMSCEQNPEGFYEKLTKVREKRKVVNQDVVKMRKLISEHVKYIGELMGRM